LQVSIIIPAYNEESQIGKTVTEICQLFPNYELIVVDDGSEDATAVRAENAGAKVISHPYNKGNGASVRTGVRAASGDIVLMMDGDGQHNPADIPRLLEHFPTYDMVVGARGMESQANLHRSIANWAYNKLASYMTSFPIQDLTSGFRAFKRPLIMRYLHLFPNGFSYPTTSTMAMLRGGHDLKYTPIQAAERIGKSKIKLFQDGFRFFLIILKLVTLFSPMRIFLPVSLGFGILGVVYSTYTLYHGYFTNMAAMLLIVSILIFLMGLVAEQLAAIHTKESR